MCRSSRHRPAPVATIAIEGEADDHDHRYRVALYRHEDKVLVVDEAQRTDGVDPDWWESESIALPLERVDELIAGLTAAREVRP